MAALTAVTACSSSDDAAVPTSTTTPTITLPSEEDCREAAREAVLPLQAFIEDYEGLTAEEWNALDPPPDVQAAQDELVSIGQAAVDRGCDPTLMEQWLAEEIDGLVGEGEVGAAIAAALRGDGPILGPPMPVPATTIPRDTEPSTVMVEPGDDLAAVLARVAPGSTIEFTAGTHTFDQPILVDLDLAFVGAGRDETIISSSAEGVAIAFVGPGGFEVGDMTVEHTGDAEASVLLAIEGPVLVERATIRGGVSGGGEDAGGGHGIVFAFDDLPGFPERTAAERAGALAVRDSTITDNDSAGILSIGTAAPDIAAVTVSGNGGCGICYAGDAGGTVASSTIEGNQIGIQIGEAASPEISDSTIIGSVAVGVSIDGSADPTISTSLIEDNASVGLQVTGSAAPIVERNTVNRHGVGVLVGESATPIISTNGIANQEIGLQVGGSAVVEATGNTIWVSSVAAISFGEQSTGVARDNSIADAPDVAIQATGDSSPRIVGNTIEVAGAVGISFVDASTGSVRGNEVLEREIGIQIGGTSSPDVADNTVTDSVTVGVLVGDASTPRVTGNTISGPESVGIVVGGTSDPVIQSNSMSRNGVGMVFREDARGTATDNTISEHTIGLQVIDRAGSFLAANSISDSKEAGAIFGGEATATFERNTLERSGNISIQVGESARPTIAGNEIRGQAVYGFLYRDRAGGTSTDNRVVNHVFGFQLNDSAAPAIIGNLLEEIALTNIVYADSTGGRVSGNTCTESFSAGISITAPANPTVGDNACSLSRSAG